MITILDGFSGNVMAARASGRVTREDYETVLIPAIKAVAKTNPKLRCYYEIGTDFVSMGPAAMWDDFRVGVEFWTRWERIAIVTDVAWMTHLMNAFRFFVPGEIRIFTVAETEEARTWVQAA
jgi:hypothetical protein